MGNSEVGHLNLGAGRVVTQDLVRINAAIDDGSFFRNETLARDVRRRARRAAARSISWGSSATAACTRSTSISSR